MSNATFEGSSASVKSTSGPPPEEYESASSRALRIPHILATILQSLQEYTLFWEPYADLYTFMFVNSAWEREANLLLWDECDIYRHTPSLKQLVAISPSRRQKYANYIRRIRIADSFPTEENWIALHLTEIANLSFPRLESLTMEAPCDELTSYHSLPMKQFAQPRLKELQLVVSNCTAFVISDEFLQELQQVSKGLKNLRISDRENARLDTKWKIPPKRLTTFLRAFQSLEEIQWDLDATMSEASFKIISHYEHLKSALIFPIHESWIDDDHSASVFPVLERLQCRMTGYALKALTKSLEQRLTELRVYEVGVSTRVLPAVIQARFKHLTSLELYLSPDTLMYGHEILAIGRCASQLQTLRIHGWYRENDGRASITDEDCPLKTENFTDMTIKELAEQLPLLTRIYLTCYSDSSVLGEASLISLGRNCPQLQRCRLFVTPDWERMMRDATPSPLWPKLYDIWTSSNRNRDHFADRYENISELVRAIAKSMPSLGQRDTSYHIAIAGNLGRALREYLRERSEGIMKSRLMKSNSLESQDISIS